MAKPQPGILDLHKAGRDGRKLKPPMGYHYYETVASDDLDAIVAYLRTVPAKE